MKKTFMATLLCFPFALSAAVYKCFDQDGKPTFQSMQCDGDGGQIEVKPASGQAPDGVYEPSLEYRANKLEAARLRKEHAHRAKIVREEIKDQYRKLAEHEAKSAAEMERLRIKKSYASNNLAGAVYQQAITQEMQAVQDANRAVSEQMRRAIEAKRRYAETLDR